MKTYYLYKTREQAENAAKADAIKCNGYIEKSSYNGTSSDFGEQLFNYPEITGEFPTLKVDAANGDEYVYAWVYMDDAEYREFIDGDLADYVAGSGTIEQIMRRAGINEDKYDSVNYIVGTLYTYVSEDCQWQGAPTEGQEKEFDARWNEAIDDLIALADDLASDDEIISDTIEHIEWLSYIKRECQEAAKRAEKNNTGEDVDFTATDAQEIEGEDAWLVTFGNEEYGITSAAIVWREEHRGDDGKMHNVVYFIDDWQGSYPACKEEIPDYDWVDENWHRCVVAADDPMPRMLFTY